jgi:hypothetical protein
MADLPVFVSSRLGSRAFAKRLKALAFGLPALSGCPWNRICS